MKLYGKNSVIERLRSNPKSVKCVYIQHGFKGTLQIHKKAKQWGIPIYTVPQSKIQKIGRNLNTQGILMDVGDFPFTDYSELLKNAIEKRRTLVFLDQLNDPQNLGGIIRSLACLGKFSIVLPKHKTVTVTETVLRVASGGDNYVPVCRVANTAQAIKKAKEEGFWIAGTVVEGGENIIDTNFSFPLGVVIGSEKSGIRDVLLKELDTKITIPMAIDTLSFNVSHATSIICYEITKQKKQKAKV